MPAIAIAIEIAVPFKSHTLDVRTTEDGTVHIYQDGLWAGVGDWDYARQSVCCSALICGDDWSDAYDAIDAALIEAGI